ncbi:PREDICTED: LDLR chaperone boca [Eufriesea mexicana]|nr:PREDICTED: LDLR chaperone boca [Eufriesea mexicana]
MRKEIIIYSIFLLIYVNANSDIKSKKKKSWRDKDIRDMTDADLEHLLDQWEENEEPLEPDELPEHLRPSPKIELSKLNMSDSDNVLKVTKKGKSVMMFVDTNEDMSNEEADTIMQIWQTSLRNNHIVTERYPIDSKRSVFLFYEGSQAIDAKKYLLQQPELSHVTLEGHTFFRDSKKQNEKMAKVNKIADKENIDKDNDKKKMEL